MLNRKEWRYTLKWAHPYTQAPGEPVLASETVNAGQPCPEWISAQHIPGSGYAICIDFPAPGEPKRWSPEAKARNRRKRLKARIEKDAPLFTEELIERELTSRPDYYNPEEKHPKARVTDIKEMPR